MSVYDVDRRRVRHTLGHVFAHLSDIDAIRGDVHWSDLEPNAQYKVCYRRFPLLGQSGLCITCVSRVIL